MKRPLRVVLVIAMSSLATTLLACANSSPIGSGEAGGAGGGVWSTQTKNGSSGAGKGSPSTGIGNGEGGGIEGVGGSGGGTSVFCGDDVCSPSETCVSCPADCGACQGVCGDGVCDPNETATSCPADCGSGAVCGDGTCDANETCASCYQDCGICACVADTFEPNNSSVDETAVSSGTNYCNLSICANDVDWIGFHVTSSLTAKITFLQAEGDLDLEIYSAQTIDYVNGSYSHTDNETVTLANLAPGTYWARIYGYKGATNPAYCFRVDAN